MRSRRQTARQGAIAGLLAATVLVVWFLVLDLIQTSALYTPRFITSVILGVPLEEVGALLIAGYTLVHYAFFVLFGASVALALRSVHGVPAMLVGFVLGFLLFDLLFYAGVVLTGEDVVRALGWPVVLAGNLLAGVTLMAYLSVTRTVESISWSELFRERQVVREGLITGLIGAAIVAVWFLVVDTLAGRPFFTPAALASALFFGATGIEHVAVTFAAVVAYTGFHVVAFAIIGLLLALLVVKAERFQPLLLALALLFVTAEALFAGLLAIAASWILDTLGWWSIALANLLSVVGMGAYLWREHPALLAALRKPSLEEPA